MNNNQKMEKMLTESYNHIQPYLHDYEGSSGKWLQQMCKKCEMYCGEEHDYEECRNKPCFKLFLGCEYTEWELSWR